MKINLHRPTIYPHVCLTKIEHLSVKSNGETILNDVNLQIRCGELTAIVGRNGAGKTTFLKALLDEIPHTGTIEYEHGTSPGGIKIKSKRKPTFGYVPQKLSIAQGSPVSVADLVQSCVTNYPVWLPRRKKDTERTRQILSMTKAEHLSEKRACDLSGGEIQRVMLALALNPLPDILILDEPVSGVDRNGLKDFYDLVSKLRHDYDITILLVSHDLDLVAEHADKVVLIDRGIAAEGTPADVYSDEKFIETFGKIQI
nr:metal ABC transporter ATP-binding protein [Treponema sp.]